MKTIFKRVLAVTAFAAANAANAQGFIDIPNPIPSTATSTLVFSNDAMSALASAGVGVTAPSVIPQVAGLPNGGAANSASYSTSPTNQLTLNNSSVSVSGDYVTSMSAPNSLLRLSRGLLDADNNLLGTYRVYLTGFELNLTQGTVYANLFASDLTGNLTAFGKTALFQADQAGVVGGAGGRLVYGSSGATASGSLAGNLRLTTQGGDIILNSLGLNGATRADAVITLWRLSNLGTASFTAPAVPEPSTWALFGVGLLGLGWSSRRRQAA